MDSVGLFDRLAGIAKSNKKSLAMAAIAAGIGKSTVTSWPPWRNTMVFPWTCLVFGEDKRALFSEKALELGRLFDRVPQPGKDSLIVAKEMVERLYPLERSRSTNTVS